MTVLIGLIQDTGLVALFMLATTAATIAAWADRRLDALLARRCA